MRSCVLPLVAMLALAGGLQAQPATPKDQTPLLDPEHNRLDAILLQWQEKMKGIETLTAKIVRVKDNKVLRTRTTFEGVASYMKPNLALLDLRQKDRPGVFERYVSTGTYLYEYNQANKELRYHELPQPKPGQVADDNFLSFLFGMKAEEAKRRYDMKLVGEDKYWIYIEVLPRLAADKEDFQKAQLALRQDTFLPGLLTFDEPNGNRISWEIPAIESGVRLNREEFMKPVLPPGWKTVRAPRPAETTRSPQTGEVPPRVIRQQQ